MRVLVCGASGFIGSTLCPMLQEDGHATTKLQRYASGRFNGYEQKDVVFADFNDPVATRMVIKESKPDIIINLAAQSAVAYSFKHPDEVMRVNLGGTVAVVEAALECGAILIQASSSEVYGRSDHTFPLKETELLGATSPYASSKISCEEYIRTAGYTSKLRYVIMRPFNTIGRANVQNRQFVVERAITQAIETERINLHDPKPSRDFVFRTDHAGAYRAMVAALSGPDAQMSRRLYGEAFNICTGDAWTIEEMAHHVARTVEITTGRKVSVEFSQVSDRPLDIDVLHGSNEKIQRILGWKPEYTIASAIEKAAEEWLTVLKK